MIMMNRLKKIFQCFCKKNCDCAKIKLGPLKMGIKKIYNYDDPHEITVVVPRVEIRKRVETPFFTKTTEIIYNSVTIVDAPQAPLSGEGSTKIIPENRKKKYSLNQEQKKEHN